MMSGEMTRVEIPKQIQELILERTLGRAAVAKSAAGRLPVELLQPAARALAELSQVFTAGRANLQQRYLEHAAKRAAYLLYYLPANLPKVWHVLDELVSHPSALLAQPTLRVLDVGAGVGTASVGVTWYVAQQLAATTTLELTAVDSAGSALGECQWLVEQLAARQAQEGSSLQVRLTTRQLDLEKRIDLAAKPYDLIFVSNTLNELFKDSAQSIEQRLAWLNRLGAEYLSPTGSLVVIEPALSNVARSLHLVRDGLLETGWHIYSPCVAERACPMLARERDWCHHTLDWARPLFVRQLDELVGNRKESVKFSYLILRRDQLRLTDRYQVSGSVYRAVGDLQREKGKDTIYLCGATGGLAHMLLKRDRTEQNLAFQALERWQLLEVNRPSTERPERFGPETRLKVLEP